MNNHAARIDRVAQMKPADLNQPPTRQEVADEIGRMKSDPDYVCKWSSELVEKWAAQLEREVEEGRNAP